MSQLGIQWDRTDCNQQQADSVGYHPQATGTEQAFKGQLGGLMVVRVFIQFQIVALYDLDTVGHRPG